MKSILGFLALALVASTQEVSAAKLNCFEKDTNSKAVSIEETPSESSASLTFSNGDRFIAIYTETEADLTISKTYDYGSGYRLQLIGQEHWGARNTRNDGILLSPNSYDGEVYFEHGRIPDVPMEALDCSIAY
jgi:hypothetical protein